MTNQRFTKSLQVEWCVLCIQIIMSCSKVFDHHYLLLVELHVQLHCTANDETEADESLCKIIDNCCHGDAPAGRPKMPQAKKKESETERERERDMLSLECRLFKETQRYSLGEQEYMTASVSNSDFTPEYL